MPTILQRLLARTSEYPHTTLTPTQGEECFNCKKEFNSEDGYPPIRLTECGHTVGLECFTEFSRRHRSFCPYTNYYLFQTVPINQSPSMIFLNWVLGTIFFSVPEYALNATLPNEVIDEINAGSILGIIVYLAIRVDLHVWPIVLLKASISRLYYSRTLSFEVSGLAWDFIHMLGVIGDLAKFCCLTLSIGVFLLARRRYKTHQEARPARFAQTFPPTFVEWSVFMKPP